MSQTKTTNILTPNRKEMIATKAIEIVNNHDFGENRGITSSNLRNLLDFVKSPSVTPKQFILYAKYQTSRLSRKNPGYKRFTDEILTTMEKLCQEFKFNSTSSQIRIYQELMIDIVMGGSFRKSVNNKEKIKII